MLGNEIYRECQKDSDKGNGLKFKHKGERVKENCITVLLCRPSELFLGGLVQILMLQGSIGASSSVIYAAVRQPSSAQVNCGHHQLIQTPSEHLKQKKNSLKYHPLIFSVL